jgi:initiation factor 1A
MVKNTKGGKGAKQKARKNLNITVSVKLDDLLPTEDQCFAKVLKVFGGGRFQVELLDGTVVLGVSSGKIRKRSYNCKEGCLVCISKRDFQQDRVDILYVYNQDEIQTLRSNNIALPQDAKAATNTDSSDETEDVDVSFANL